MYAKLANLRRAEAPETYASVARATQMPLVEAISSHAFAAERIHADHFPAPVTAQTHGPKRRLWTRDKPACRARSAAAVSLLLAASERGEATHASG